MFPATLRRNIRYCAFKNFQKRLLHSLSRNISGYRTIFTPPGNFINFINIYNSLFGAFNIIICSLNKAEQNIFNIFTDISGLSQSRSISNCERNTQGFRKRLRKISFAYSGRTEKKYIALLNYHRSHLSF